MEGSSQAHEITPLRAIKSTPFIPPRHRTDRSPRDQRRARAPDCADCQGWGDAGVVGRLSNRIPRPLPSRFMLRRDAQAHQAQISMGSLCDARLPLISEEREQLPREEEEDHPD
jgi:hypothetical protein